MKTHFRPPPPGWSALLPLPTSPIGNPSPDCAGPLSCEPSKLLCMPAAIDAKSEKLAPVPLRHELTGRLRNLGRLKHWQMAVAEAIHNALDAAAESGRACEISVEIERAADLATSGGGGKPVKTIVVRDDGVGFTEENFISFCTPDSRQKEKGGGKGLGRLTCLQAFGRVRVHSVFKDVDGWKERRVVLQSESPELQASVSPSDTTGCSTEVRLEELRTDFQAGGAVSFDQVAEWLAEHFLPALVEPPKSLKSFTLQQGNDRLDLTKMIEGASLWVQKFAVRGYEFRAVCYSVTSAGSGDMVRLVAGGRIVHANTRPLEFYLPHLASISKNRPHLVLIYSSFFDEHVNDARNGVSFAEEGDGILLGLTAPEFRDACASALKGSLSAALERSLGAFKERISAVVAKEAPYYRPLLLGFFASKDFLGLSTSSRDEEILSALDTYKRRDATKLKQESRRLAKLKTSEGAEEYLESARKLAEQIETQKKVALAEYVTLRKIILERLQQLLEVQDNGKSHREAAIHNLVFPQRADTESAPGTDHQLWILDERLESHNYLASDKAMDGKSGDRPDLLVALDRPGAFGSQPFSESRGYERIVLVEFKRALEDLAKVPTDDLPHQQMIRYARQITDEKALHLGSGRPIKTAADARFYMYAVCEVSQALLKRLEETGFTPSPTGNGSFWVTNKGRYYIEYISLPKLLEDAQARNVAFFKRLGLEP